MCFVCFQALGNKTKDGTMTTVVTNTMTEPNSHHPLHHSLPLHRNHSNSATTQGLSKSITRLLQHSILQLCNEHIGYTHKLQILGVLCMTVDDEQQELVVKVNNTLKRVGPVTPKDGAQLAATGMAPSVHPLSPHTHMQGTDLSMSRAASSAGRGAEDVGSHPASPAPSPIPLNMCGRKSHGRKGSNPTKVAQVLEDPHLDMMDSDEDSDEPLTIIPEAPETTGSHMSSGPPSPVASSTPTSAPTGRAPSGSAKRKPSHQFRVPQYPSPAASPYVRPLPNEPVGSPYGGGLGEEGADGAASTSGSRSSAHHGISLPIYVAGTYSHEGQDAVDDQPINLAAGSSASTSSPSRHHSHQHLHHPSQPNGLLAAMNGRASPREGSPDARHAHNGERPGSTHSTHRTADDPSRVKDEPDDDSETEYKEQLSSLEEYARANVAALFSPGGDGGVADRDARMEGLHAALPYSTLGMYLPRHGFDSPSPSSSRDGDGLTIKYTSTGPYTVGANGKDVSNSSRIKDIIMYDDQSPLSAQKGARIETDYIVDKLGMDGRKRRRRAPEDLLTPEEIAEYLGQPERSDFNFRCKYCSEEFDSITRYIHHTLASHQAYICHQCGKSFTTKSSLLRHRPIHTGMRRFACSICKKTFYRKDKCKAHIRRHLGLDQSSGLPVDAATTSGRVVPVEAPTTSPLPADLGSNSSQFPTPIETSAVEVDSP